MGNYRLADPKTKIKELKEKGLKSWAEVALAAEDRGAWKQRGDSPILHQENRTMMIGPVRKKAPTLVR